MKYKLKKPIPFSSSTINDLVVGASYLGLTQVYYGPDGPVTVEEIHKMNSEWFEIIDTSDVKTQIMINLSNQYVDLQKHYGFDEDGMANKLGEIAEKICSKI